MFFLKKRMAKPLVVTVLTTAIFGLTGCATTQAISPDYVSPSNYQNFNCSQLSVEYQRVKSYINNTKPAKFRLASTGINVGLAANRNGVYPTISVGSRTSSNHIANNSKLAKLYGEHDAIIQSANMKNCKFASKISMYAK